MKILRTLMCAALLVAGLSGCEKIDVNKLEGTWTEQYDPTVFAMDGSVEYTFDGNNGYQLHVYDALSGESHDYSGAPEGAAPSVVVVTPHYQHFKQIDLRRFAQVNLFKSLTVRRLLYNAACLYSAAG